MIKFFLVGVFCVTQPVQDCTRIAGSSFFDSKEACSIAQKSFIDEMMTEVPSSKIILECVSAYPIPNKNLFL
tara:strand:- start:479 stop:694 length:216 start_codon:yes stop_codon:yes gene_type:complete